MFQVGDKPFIREFHSWEEAKHIYAAQKDVETQLSENPDAVFFSANSEYSEEYLFESIHKVELAQEELRKVLSPFAVGTTKVLTLGDIELPYANEALINKAIRTAKDEGVQIVVLNGDITHSDFFSKHAKTSYISPSEEYRQLQKLIAVFAANFEHVVIVRGNHDQMVERYCQRMLPLEHLEFLVRPDLLQNVAENYPNVHYAANWWVKVFDAVYQHPYTYSSIPMRTGLNAAMAIKRFTDFRAVFTAHTHAVGSIIVDGVNYVETGCSCLMQNYMFMRVQKTRWIPCFNISAFVNGKIDFNQIRNYTDTY